MKIGFCTNDLKTVDEHYGRATKVAIYEIDEKSYTLSEVREFAEQDEGTEHKLDTGSKAEKLADCAILYVAQIGGPAAAHVIKNKIHPVKVNDPVPIAEILENLKTTLAGNPAPWLKKALYRDRQPE
ncbi:nitrogen fixation protein NifX [Seleniivibrio woodruffii]|uniref:nitrogen fixation protein NifX n=1 Tax=Seleniivibrio woodruffii TaxID=1078050 RepID=UPI0026EB788F|nr:nitrogen fixation protein NifX [Seleniivibrio woodruffii]